MTDNKLRDRNIALYAARLADAKKAESVSVYDMGGRSELADYVVVVTVDNPAQLEAVEEEITAKLKQEGFYALYRDGMTSKNWKVLDYGALMIHLFEKQAREFYSFDRVYAGYKTLKWEKKTAGPENAPARLPAHVRKAKAGPAKAGKPAAKRTGKTAAKTRAKKPAAARKKPAKRTAAKKKR